MAATTIRWGTPFFLAALPLIGLLYYLFYAVPFKQNPLLYHTILPLIGLAASAFTLFFGHVSYSRLHSAKMYFLGYLAGSAGLFYFILCKPFFSLSSLPPVSPGFVELLVLLLLLDLAAVAFIPAGTKYRITRSLTLTVLTIEMIVLLINRFGGQGTDKALIFTSFQDPLFVSGIVLSVFVILVTLWQVRQEFFLGGVISGAVLFLAAAWVSGPVVPAADIGRLHLILLAATPLYLSLGMIVHGFSRMEHRISFDPLLKIYNRDYCSRIITEQANLNVAPPFAVAMVDIDHFKKVNDTFGHQAGDAVLHAVAQAVLREAGEDGIVCRYGGEELIVFFPQSTIREVTEIVERIRAEVESIKTPAGRKSITVTISSGISQRESLDQSIVDVIQAADKALYSAKEGGRNQVRTRKTPIRERK